ncbi:MAG: BrnT family toxin [Pseudomonas sp.]|uniref:BrnT family toxin n=1 Tax=Pseudomonas sp. TaxID=306 RepID=UPI00120A503B|nr:BrnT family toxin [Pseudomonas sp.]RZI74737.1 MAG: BrnT family toxin [Pseudomonas sp.]
MLIEFDETKRAKTLQERGLDFADAGQVLDGAQLTQADERHDYDELRHITFGALAGRMVVVWTPRGAARRIISMRYANDREIARYASALG